VLVRQFGEAIIEVGNGVARIGQCDIKDDLIWEQDSDRPVQAFCRVDADGENWLWHVALSRKGPLRRHQGGDLQKPGSFGEFVVR
jgi:hypothetical protein